MTTFIIEIPEKEKATVLGFLKKHGVKVQEAEKELTKEEVLAGLEQGLREAKDRIDGKLKRKPKTLSQIKVKGSSIHPKNVTAETINKVRFSKSED